MSENPIAPRGQLSCLLRGNQDLSACFKAFKVVDIQEPGATFTDGGIIVHIIHWALLVFKDE